MEKIIDKFNSFTHTDDNGQNVISLECFNNLLEECFYEFWDYNDKEQLADRKAYTKEEQKEIFNKWT